MSGDAVSQFGSGLHLDNELVSLDRKHRKSVNYLAHFFNWAQAECPSMAENAASEMAWIANLFAAGWKMHGTPLSPSGSAKVTKNIVELGLDILIRQPEVKVSCLTDIFNHAWSALYGKVAQPAAKALDKILRVRSVSNQPLRDAWFRCCKKRKLSAYSISMWIRQGKYALVSEVIGELEFELGTEASLLCRLLLDDMPKYPLPKFRMEGNLKITQRSCFFKREAELESAVLQLKKLLIG
jgi:hypothetical protein